MKTVTLVLLALLVCEVDATPNKANTDSFLRDFYAAYSAKDATRMSQFYATDATFVDPSFELNFKGPDEIRALLRRCWRNMIRSIGKSRTRHRPAMIWWWKER